MKAGLYGPGSIIHVHVPINTAPAFHLVVPWHGPRSTTVAPEDMLCEGSARVFNRPLQSQVCLRVSPRSYLVSTRPWCWRLLCWGVRAPVMAAIMALVGLAAMLPLPRHLPAPRTARSLPLMGRVDGRRQGRVAQVVRKELAEVLHTGDIRGKRLATSIREMISIVDVDVSPDLRNARVKVSILGDRKDKISAVRWLQSSRGGIRYCMGKRMKEFKRLPEIKFEHVDVGQAVDVMVLIDKLAAERRDESGAAVMR